MGDLKFALFIWIVVIAYSCDNDPIIENEDSCFQVDLKDSTKYPLEQKWIFLGFIDPETKIEDCKPVSLKEMNIEFMDTKEFHATSSCNFLEGTFSISSPDSLRITRIMSTEIYCFNDTTVVWEERYFNGLKKAKNYKIDGNRLTIKTHSDFDLIYKAN